MELKGVVKTASGGEMGFTHSYVVTQEGGTMTLTQGYVTPDVPPGGVIPDRIVGRIPKQESRTEIPGAEQLPGI